MEETMTVAETHPEPHLSPMTLADRKAAGKRLRDRVPRDAHAGWQAHAGRTDPVGILHAADATRQPELVPLRYGRMLQSAFTFYRARPGSWQPIWRKRRRPESMSRCAARPTDEFRWLRHAGAPTPLRHQRPRRDLASALGVGRQTARRLLCARRPRQWAHRRERPRCGGRLRPQLSPENARLCRHGRARHLVRAARRQRLSGDAAGGAEGRAAQTHRQGYGGQQLRAGVSQAGRDGRWAAPYMQGVDALGDFAVQLRMKMMTLPGENFLIRRQALAMIKKAFDANGIKFAFPTVQIAGDGEPSAAAVAHRALELTQPAAA